MATYLDTYTWSTWATTSTSSTISHIHNPWLVWTESTSTPTSSYVWTQWSNSPRIIAPAAPAPILTPEQIASERRRDEERERRWKAERAARKAAEERAQELLLTHLTEEQREAIKARNFFVIEGGKSKDKYRIWTNKGVHGNIERLDKNGRAVASLCVQLREVVCPNGDHFLAQKLMLELAEEDILKVANTHRLVA